MKLIESIFLVLILLGVSSIFLAIEIRLSGVKDKLQADLYTQKPSLVIYFLQVFFQAIVIMLIYLLGWTTVLKFLPAVYGALMANALNVHLCILEESTKVYPLGILITFVLFSI